MQMQVLGSVPGRMRHEENTDSENERRHELQTKGDPPCSLMLGSAGPANEVRAIVDPEGDHDAERDGELLKSDQASTDFRRGQLGTEDD